MFLRQLVHVEPGTERQRGGSQDWRGVNLRTTYIIAVFVLFLFDVTL